MLRISKKIVIPLEEIEITTVRAQGAGGQNVNKVATAIHLRFDISSSSLPELYKKRLFKLKDNRITKEGVIIIKAQQYRRQQKNKEAAFFRLQSLIKKVLITRKRRVPTHPSKNSQEKRLEEKKQRGKLKVLRKKVADDQA